MSTRDRKYRGPIEDTSWPEALEANVVEQEPSPRIHGYDVQADLARHYGFVDTFYLALAGELPGDMQRRAFDVTLQFLAPAWIGRAPTHAACVVRLCGADAAGVSSAGTVALAEQARYAVEAHRPLLEWLDGRGGTWPDGFSARGVAERQSVQRLKEALPEAMELSVFDHDPTLLAALIAVLHALGLGCASRIVGVWVCAQLPCLMGEAAYVEPLGFDAYPMDLPSFRYTEE